jgi:hypothetical protein
MSEVEEKGKKLESIYNSATKTYVPEIEWHAMNGGGFVLKSKYVVEDGLDALREQGWKIYNIEAICTHESAFGDENPDPYVDIFVRKEDDN